MLDDNNVYGPSTTAYPIKIEVVTTSEVNTVPRFIDDVLVAEENLPLWFRRGEEFRLPLPEIIDNE